MFDKILIANRGEIACRVIKTARKMGVKTVAVYSDADKNALHVEMADEAVHIGKPASAKSYLRADRIIRACKKTKAQAVHPGYGFLSENKDFQLALKKAGIAFIGPNSKAIEAMGDKITSKKLAGKAGVPTVPGHMGIIKDTDEAVKIAKEIGYPVMLKASAGGGGKGMRVAYNNAEAREGFERATSEAKSSFGDDRVFIEKFVEQPRHIEIQILADSHGHCIYVGERECSIQRRHQKVIEEAPSPFIDEKTRKAMGKQAVAMAKAVDYVSAGTVEFIVDAKRNFYFLEMNTRLQVEHPVTELITGLDLVEWMIRVADGEKLTVKQSDVKLNGWAMESRIYAEDPYRNFLPSTGRLVSYRLPEESKHVRVDTGVYEGGEISMFYDPMVAKLCTWGKTRKQAIAHMRDALDHYYIRGISHNIPFLASVMSKKRFVDGKLTTNFIAEEYPDGFSDKDLPADDPVPLIAVAALIHRAYSARAGQISGSLKGHEIRLSNHWVVDIAGKQRAVKISDANCASGSVKIGRRKITVESDWTYGEPLFNGTVGGDSVCVQVDRNGIGYRLSHNGAHVEATVYTARDAELAKLMPHKIPPDMSRFLLSPMPGLLVAVEVTVGQEVKAGETLAIVEAMKMENVLKAERDGTVKVIPEEAGASLAVDQVIMEFE
ncbi:MAG: acetyl/propionyl/methylcrotonyl-CoA carboxylase subunit alpha [Rhodospirillaceae bacterium]|jgi:propionyl-CoA carboxylase alpha chain|nr:acetyl/propionyl/methylcrotonyl-CoA carboxylase subunit alpha [Rhodospirillaceae bacterium]